MEQIVAPAMPAKKKRTVRWLLLIAIILSVGAFIFLWYQSMLSQAPQNFPVGKPIEITLGMNLTDITQLLQRQNVIRSPLLLKFELYVHFNPNSVKASTYTFTKPLSVAEVAAILMKGDFTSNLIKITHIEGESVVDLSHTLKNLLPNLDTTDFIKKATSLEGRLFPDTYLVPANFSVDKLIATMQLNYEKNLAPLRTEIASSGLSEMEVITLASIIEREANSSTSMKVVAGILRKRLELHMPLQVDATLEYVLDTSPKKLTADDLEIDFPYNTYKHFGLPPTPIGNPGLTAIKAVLNPTVTPYVYYLTDSDGIFHYARTFEEHKANIARYLR